MQMGKTKVFLRRTAFEGLEHLRSEKVFGAAAAIQSCLRMYFARTQYEIAIYAVTVIQSFARCVTAYRLARAQKIFRSVLLIQKTWRGYESRQYYFAAQWITWWCQSTYRGSKARQFCAYLFLHRRVSSIQCAWRHYKRSRMFRRTRRAVIMLQNRQRLKMAKAKLSRLRVEARDVSTVKAERDKYREELLSLQKELQQAKRPPPVVEQTPPPRLDRSKEVEALRNEVQHLQIELEKAHRLSSTTKCQAEDVAVLIEELARREEQLEALKKEVETLRSRDDSFSVKSLSFQSSPAGVFHAARNFDSPMAQRHGSPRKQGSPVRSDVSLLDVEDETVRGLESRGIGLDSISQKSSTSPRASTESIVHSDSFTDNIPAPPYVGRKPDPIEVHGGPGLNSLHVAIRQGNREVFDEILRSSSETCLLINQGDKYGRTALHLAALALRTDMAEVLILKGAVVNAQDDDGETPLHLSESPAVTALLVKKGRANPNIPNVDGICAIHLAVQRRDIDSVRILLRNGANVNNADNVRWFTPLHLVALPARHERDEKPQEDVCTRIAQLLCGPYGAVKPDLDYQDSQSNSPLHYAAQLKTNEASGIMNV